MKAGWWCFHFFFILVFSSSALGQNVDTIDHLSNQKELISKLEGLTEHEIKNQYGEISRAWSEIADHLKQHFNKRSDENLSREEWQRQVTEKFQLLRRAGRLRGRALRKLRADNDQVVSIDEQTLSAMATELSIIPYKFLAYSFEKQKWLNKSIQGGVVGVYNLVIEILILLVLFLIPFVFFKASKSIDDRIEQQRRKSFYLSFKSQLHRNLATFLSILTGYLPWLFSLLALRTVSGLLGYSNFSEIQYLLPYAYYYVYYKLFRVTLEYLLRELAAYMPMQSKTKINEKITSTSRFLGVVLLSIYSLKSAFQAILGESLIFSVIEPFFGLLILGLLFYVSSRWEKEIEQYLKQSNNALFKVVSKRMEAHYSLFLSLPALLLLVIHFTGVKLIEWSSQFESFKLIYARLLRAKYESTRSDSSQIPLIKDDYITEYEGQIKSKGKDFFFKKPFFEKIDFQVMAWKNDENIEQTVAVHGPKGIGKSHFLNDYKLRLEEQGLDCLYLKVPPKVFTENSFERTFDELLKLKGDEKKVVFLDDAHNLFLSTIGGFQIYQKFLEMTEELKNIFWVASYNEYSWQFLNAVLGKNDYYRIVAQMPRWSAEEIKELILDVHDGCDFEIAYDQIFKSSQRIEEEVTSAENRYFYLIWEKSHGNPGVAIRLWYRSLRDLGQKRLRVCLPQENPVVELSQMHQEAHFIYASIVKHDNLTISEASRSTGLPRAVVRQAIYRGLEEGFIEEVSGRYKIDLDWIDDVKKFLKGKNLLYEG